MNEALENLIARWRNKAENETRNGSGIGIFDGPAALLECADELEMLMENEADDQR